MLSSGWILYTNSKSSIAKSNHPSGDLHPNNILVVGRPSMIARDLGHSEDFAVITDIGEGKLLTTRTVEPAPGASYGCAEFRPPGVRGTWGWTPAADIFPFGVLCCKIFEDGEEIVPEGIANMICACLQCDPVERPTARKLVWDLDDQAGSAWYEDHGSQYRRW